MKTAGCDLFSHQKKIFDRIKEKEKKRDRVSCQGANDSLEHTFQDSIKRTQGQLGQLSEGRKKIFLVSN